MKTYTVTVAPTVEPVGVDAVKRLSGIYFGDFDADIADKITAARQWLERKTGRALLTQTVQLVSTLYDEIVRMPVSGLIGESTRLAVELIPGPVQSVATVEFETQTNTWRMLLSGTEYLLDNLGNESTAYLYLADYVLGYWTGTFTGISIYPVERRGPRLRVTYQAGYGATATSVPYTLRECVKQAAGYLYDNPGCPIPDSLLPSEFIPYRV